MNRFTLKLSPIDRLSLEETARLANAVQREFGDVPIVREHVWASPHFAILASDNLGFAGSISLVPRTAQFDGKTRDIVGIHNLITEPRVRSLGLGRQLVEAAIVYSRNSLKTETLVLFCAEKLVAYYESLGFRLVKAEVWIDQPTGRKTWASSCLVNTSQPLPNSFSRSLWITVLRDFK